MITDKAKRFLTFLLCVVVAVLAVSCNKKGDGGDILQGLIPVDTSEGEQEQNDYAAADLYRIVIPESSTPSLVSAANFLKDNLTVFTTIDAEVVFDYQSLGAIEGTVEILLGYTSRPESESKLSKMRDKDYICEWYGEKLIIGGKSQEATVVAVNCFCENILPDSTVAVLMRKDQKFNFSGEYGIEEIKLNGFSLCEYKIVYENGYRTVAESFADNVRAKSGYILDLVSAEEYNGGKYISVGAFLDSDITVQQDSAFIGTRGNNVYILGSGENEIKAALEDFSEGLLSNGNYLPDKTMSFNYPRIDIQMLSYKNNGDLTISETNDLISLVKGFDSSFVLTNEINNDLLKRVAFGANSFGEIKSDVGRSYSVAILYDESKVSLVGKGEQETLVGGSIAWGEFKTDSGDPFLIINCYYTGVASFDNVSGKINEIVSEKNLPFVVAVHKSSGSYSIEEFERETDCLVDRISRYGYALFASEDFALNAPLGSVLSTDYGAFYEEAEIKKIK